MKMVYEPQEDSYLLLAHIKKLARGKVLDMGAGSGILAQGAATNPAVEQVYAVDIDEQAVSELIQSQNKPDKPSKPGEPIRSDRTGNIKVSCSDLFANVSEKFDTIIFNPPYLPSEEKDKNPALDGGAKGYELIKRFLEQAKKYLTPAGFILMVFSNRTGKKEVDKAITKQGFEFELLEKKQIAFFEELYVYKIKKGVRG